MTTETGVAWGEVLDRLRSSVAGEFEILREIGSGRIAAVFLAREIALSRQVAIKVMSPWLLTDAERVERFRTQAVTVAALDHPNIVPVYAVRHDNDLHFFVEKFIRGRSLAQAIRTSGPLPIPLVRGLLYMIGDALAHAHRHGVVHGGINPANVLIDGTGEAIVKDFGMERGPWGGDESWIGWQSGTATYSSPEQCLSQPVTDASDQYSLGVVAYEMLTGRPPFTGSQFQLMQAHTASPIPVIAEYRPDSPPDLSEAVARMLSKDPADRWPSIQHAMAETGAAPLPGGSPTRLALAKIGTPERDPSAVGRPSGGVAAAPEQRVQAPPSEVSSVAILSPPVSIEVGDELTLRATARKWSGESVQGAGIHWQTDNPTVVAIDEVTGLIRAFSPGCAVITARIDAVRAAVALVVTPARVAELSVLDPPGVVHVGHRIMLSAIPRDRLGNALASRPVLWASADSEIASVTTNGIATARGYGTVDLTCTCEGHTASIELRVAKPEPVAERPTFVPVVAPPMPLVGFAEPDEEEEPELVTSVPIVVPTTPLVETEDEGIEPFTEFRRTIATRLRQWRLAVAFVGGVVLAFAVAVLALRPRADARSTDPRRAAAPDSTRPSGGSRSPDEGISTGSATGVVPVASPKAEPPRPRTTLNGSVSPSRPPDPPSVVKPLRVGAGVATLGEKAAVPSLSYDSNLKVSVANPSANLPAITAGGPRGPIARTFADSAANVLQRFVDAIRQRDISSIRGKLQQGLADQLERGVNSTRDPIAVRLVGLTYDAPTAKAFFRLQVEDSAKQALVPAADLEVTFQRVPGGLRIQTVDPRR
jgi:hypothetical protein